MRLHTVRLDRGVGKSTMLAEYVAELQDAGADLVVVCVADEKKSVHWFDLLFSVGIDPSRFMLVTPQILDKARGQDYVLAGIDDADMMVDGLSHALDVLLPPWQTEAVMITSTEPIGDIG